MAENTPNLSTLSALPQEGVQAAGQLQNTLLQNRQISEESNRAAGAQQLGYAEIASRDNQFNKEQEGVNQRFNQEISLNKDQFQQSQAQQMEQDRRRREFAAWEQKKRDQHDLDMRQFDADQFNNEQSITDQLENLNKEEEEAKARGAVDASEAIAKQREELIKQQDANRERLSRATVYHHIFQPGGGGSFADMMKHAETLDLQEDQRWGQINNAINNHFSNKREGKPSDVNSVVDAFVRQVVQDPSQQAAAREWVKNLLTSQRIPQAPEQGLLSGIMDEVRNPLGLGAPPQDTSKFDRADKEWNNSKADYKKMAEEGAKYGLSKGDIGRFLLNLKEQADTHTGTMEVVDPKTGEVARVLHPEAMADGETDEIKKLYNRWTSTVGPVEKGGKSGDVLKEVAHRLSQGYLEDPTLQKMMDGLPARQRDQILKVGREAFKQIQDAQKDYRNKLMGGPTTSKDWELDQILGQGGPGVDLEGSLGRFEADQTAEQKTLAEKRAQLEAPEKGLAEANKRYLDGPGKDISKRREQILSTRKKREAPRRAVPGIDDWKE